LFDSPPLDWSSAQTACEGEGANLASIANEDEQNAVWGLAATADTWIGLNDKGSHLTYYWTDGSTFDPAIYEYWYPNRPKDKAGQDCVRMKETGQPGKWDNVSCNKSYQYVCSKSAWTC